MRLTVSYFLLMSQVYGQDWLLTAGQEEGLSQVSILLKSFQIMSPELVVFGKTWEAFWLSASV